MITLLKRRAIGRFLVGCYITTETVMYERRIQIHWTFVRLIPGSAMWQIYHDKNQGGYRKIV